ncbi:MAG: hypothetical protein UR26_C0004G0056 [candidate division TM6 bacterium GW2011_GWF2_32_72]|nr:MAG: hypothetical protein UR26_C0004G0056 [candidate division TM6 bacterium GW2011_GWF2_32_72]
MKNLKALSLTLLLSMTAVNIHAGCGCCGSNTPKADEITDIILVEEEIYTDKKTSKNDEKIMKEQNKLDELQAKLDKTTDQKEQDKLTKKIKKLEDKIAKLQK